MRSYEPPKMSHVEEQPKKCEGDIIEEVRFDLKKLPSWTKLNEKVRKIEKESSWWDRYGVDWFYIAMASGMVPVGLQCLKSDSLVSQCAGIVLLGYFYCVLFHKSGHIASHNSLCDSTVIGSMIFRFLAEYIGAYSSYLGTDNHIKYHHPHTNIIGLGDSSVWKIPQLSRIQYLFIAPWFSPILAPVLSIKQLTEGGLFAELTKYLLNFVIGMAIHVYVLMKCSNFSFSGALLCILLFKGIFSVQFIHINIFQHIGLPMYSNDHRPARMYQMASGALNLHSNLFLNLLFGHSLVSCHVEHHLFPRLSDNMCLKVKPIVREYLLEHGLPYKEDSYYNRLKVFMSDYDRLMVNAPPITHFIGIQ